MTIPGSVYYVQFKENDRGRSPRQRCHSQNRVLRSLSVAEGQAPFNKSYAVSNERNILVNSLDPGKTYTTILVAGDGLDSETKSDPQMISTLSKGESFVAFVPLNYLERLSRIN